MLPANLRHTTQVIHDACAAVAAQVEPGVVLDSHVFRHTTQAKRLLPSHILQHALLVGQRAFRLAQGAQILLQEAVGNLLIERHGILQEAMLLFVDVLAKHSPHLRFVITLQHGEEELVFLLLLLLAGITDIATDQQDDRQHSHRENRELATEIHHGNDQCRRDESRARCDEPTTDHAQHTGNAEDRRLTSPSPVGQRGTHRHHEGHVSSRERKFQRGAQRHQKAGQH